MEIKSFVILDGSGIELIEGKTYLISQKGKEGRVRLKFYSVPELRHSNTGWLTDGELCFYDLQAKALVYMRESEILSAELVPTP